MTSRFISTRYFMLDAFIISLLLIFLEQEVIIPIAWSWLAIATIVSSIAYLFFSKYTYRIIVVIGISLIAILILWVVEVPLWLAFLLGIVIIYMLHNRYSAFYDETNDAHQFLMKFFVVFSICWVILLLNPEAQSSQLLFSIVPVAVLFYVVSNVIYRYQRSKSEGAQFTQVAAAMGVLFGLASLMTIITFFIADEVRQGVGWIVGGAIRIVFWPLALLMDQVSQFLSGLTTEEDMQETIDKLGPDDEITQNNQVVSEVGATDYPVEILLGLVLVGCVFALVLWLRKIKPTLQNPEKETSSSIKRYEHLSAESVVSSTTKPVYSEMNLHQIREVFRELEKTAKKQELGREDYETVREWVVRMGWNVSDSFYHTYDRVRYGDKQLPELQAAQFIADIQKIKDNYLKENV